MQAGEKGRRCLEEALLPHLDALLAAAAVEEKKEEDEDKVTRESVLDCLQQHKHGGRTIEEAAALQKAGWLLPWLVAWRVRPQPSSLLLKTLCQVGQSVRQVCDLACNPHWHTCMHACTQSQ